MAAPNLTALRGDTWTATLTITGDLTGCAVRLIVKPLARWGDTLDTGASLTLTSSAGLTVTPGALTSTIDVLVAASTMAALAPGVYVFDVQTTLAGVVETIWWDSMTTLGTLTIEGDVTRTTP